MPSERIRTSNQVVGATDIECPKGPRQAVGTPDERRVTHHLVGNPPRCAYCRQTRSAITEKAGLL